MNIDFQGRKLEGSQHVDQMQNLPKVRSSIILSTNPDHVGGFRLAEATFEGIELLEFKMFLNLICCHFLII